MGKRCFSCYKNPLLLSSPSTLLKRCLQCSATASFHLLAAGQLLRSRELVTAVLVSPRPPQRPWSKDTAWSGSCRCGCPTVTSCRGTQACTEPATTQPHPHLASALAGQPHWAPQAAALVVLPAHLNSSSLAGHTEAPGTWGTMCISAERL